MERKIKLRDIVGYLPYGLNVFDKTQGNFFKYEIDDRWDIYQVLEDDLLIPILRPLSDLCKTITHNGKEIIPIIELADISYANNDWFLNEHNSAECENYIFGYSGMSFWCINTKKQYDEKVYYQFALFDFMNELKIDYRGLIENKIAISCYDLSENPYK